MASASPPPSLKLTVEKGPKEGEWVEAKNCIRIGRVVRGNSLAIKEDGISSKHLLIQLDHLGRAWVLQDLNSSNGTILNTSPVPPNAPVHLSHGDTIKIGAYTVLKVHIGPQQAGGASSHSHPIPRNSTRQARGGPNKKAMADGGGGGGRTTRGARVDGRNGGGDAGVTCEVVESVETRAVGGGGRTTRSSARVDGGASTKAVEAPAAVERRGGRKIKAMADKGGGGGRTTRDGVDGRNGGGDAGVTSKLSESVETQGVGGGGRTTRSRARVNGGASTKVLEAPAAVERRGGRKTRGRGGDGDSVGVSAGAEIVLEAPKQRKGRPPRRAGTSKTALEVEKVEEEEEEEHVSTVSGAAEGIEQMVSNLGSKDEGGCEETGDLVPTETVAAASGRKGNLDGVPNLDMPLGEWLDYVERQLLQQIDEETELIIEGMKLKAKRVAEYVASCGEQLHQSDK